MKPFVFALFTLTVNAFVVVDKTIDIPSEFAHVLRHNNSKIRLDLTTEAFKFYFVNNTKTFFFDIVLLLDSGSACQMKLLLPQNQITFTFDKDEEGTQIFITENSSNNELHFVTHDNKVNIVLGEKEMSINQNRSLTFISPIHSHHEDFYSLTAKMEFISSGIIRGAFIDFDMVGVETEMPTTLRQTQTAISSTTGKPIENPKPVISYSIPMFSISKQVYLIYSIFWMILAV
uniref:Uncharacterized protein n=1 Tax=Panagrolaimus sp. JU765 TaxID=591449 RepID=A0AC34RR10_9BILA